MQTAPALQAASLTVRSRGLRPALRTHPREKERTEQHPDGRARHGPTKSVGMQAMAELHLLQPFRLRRGRHSQTGGRAFGLECRMHAVQRDGIPQSRPNGTLCTWGKTLATS